jgi:alkyl hydroperoxide reductase subunit AhpF
MSMISASDTQVIRDHFAKNLTGEVRITYYGQQESALQVPTRECQYCEETRQILEELAVLSPNIKLSIVDFFDDETAAPVAGIARIPAIVLEGAAKGRVRYFGVPAGYEFSALVEDIVDVGRGEPGLSAATLASLATLTEDVHIQVFSTPT